MKRPNPTLLALLPLAPILLGLASAGCSRSSESASAPVGVSTAASGITGGSTVQPTNSLSKSIPLILIMDTKTGRSAACSGTIVADDLVITAGHCFAEITPDTIAVAYLGNDPTDKHFDKSRVTAIDNFRVNPNFDQNFGSDDNDVALAHLASPLPADHVVIQVLKDRSLLVPGAPLMLAGFGPPAKTSSFILRSLPSKLDHLTANNKVIAATTPRGFTDHGDSGGPALIKVNGKYFVIGDDNMFVSEGSFLESYEDVTAHLDWLQSAAVAMGSKSQL